MANETAYTLMCPHCGWKYDAYVSHSTGLVPAHAYPATPVGGRLCPGAGQLPRNPDSDRRPLWKDLSGQKNVQSDFQKWMCATFTADEPHAILPGRKVKVGVIEHPHILTAEQALALALYIMQLSGLKPKDVKIEEDNQ